MAFELRALIIAWMIILSSGPMAPVLFPKRTRRVAVVEVLFALRFMFFELRVSDREEVFEILRGRRCSASGACEVRSTWFNKG